MERAALILSLNTGSVGRITMPSFFPPLGILRLPFQVTLPLLDTLMSDPYRPIQPEPSLILMSYRFPASYEVLLSLH